MESQPIDWLLYRRLFAVEIPEGQIAYALGISVAQLRRNLQLAKVYAEESSRDAADLLYANRGNSNLPGGRQFDPMSGNFNAHFDTDSIELYAMGRLPEEHHQRFEEHLLVCPSCQGVLAEADRFTAAMREACRRLATAPAASRTLWNPRLAWSAALAAVVVMTLAIPDFPGRSAPEQEIRLTAMRGVEPSASASGGGSILLRLDVTELPTAPAYALEIADSTGLNVWQGHSVAHDGEIVHRVAASLSPGQYWVRIYGQSAERPLLREFSLPVAD